MCFGVGWCGRAGVLRGRLLGAVGDHRAASRATTPSIYAPSGVEQAAASQENLYSVPYGLLLYEDEIRSVEGRQLRREERREEKPGAASWGVTEADRRATGPAR